MAIDPRLPGMDRRIQEAVKNMPVPQGPMRPPRRAILGIDGTGSHTWADVDQRRSFVKKLVHQIPAESRCYMLGADEFATNTDKVLENAFQYLNNQASKGIEEVILTGYSRGGAAVTYLSHWLQIQVATNRMKMRVPAIILFDAVSRDARLGLHDIQTISKICETVVHARRDPKGYSRPYMSNAAVKRNTAGGTQDALTEPYEMKYFYASHSGVGGMPWEAKYYEKLTADKVPMSLPLWDLGSWWDALPHAQNQILGVVFRESIKFCKVSLADDIVGSQRVGEWVWGRLKELGLLPPGASPTTFAPAGHAIKSL